MVKIRSGADFVQGLIGIFKERHQTDLARIVIFCFLGMAELILFLESKFGHKLCSFSFFVLLFVASLLLVVLNLDSSLFVLLYLKVHQLFRELILTLQMLFILRITLLSKFRLLP